MRLIERKSVPNPTRGAARARQGGENEDERFAHEDSKPGSARRSHNPGDAMNAALLLLFALES